MSTLKKNLLAGWAVALFLVFAIGLVPLLLGGSFASSIISPISSSTGSPVVALGSYQQIGLAGILQFKCVVGNPLTAQFSTCRKGNSSTGYQVTAGKTLTLTRTLFTSSAAGGFYTLLYGSSDVGWDSVAAPTSPAYLSGTVNQGSLIAPVASTTYDIPILYTIPAGTYPAIAGNVNGATIVVTFWGVEN